MHLAMPLQRMEWLGFAACAAVLALLASSLLLRLARDRTLRHTLHAVARRCEDRRLPRRALLVIAHPDDEAMFFSPTLLALAQAHVDVDVLCLSTGNFAGLGRTRTQELRAACGVLKVDKVSVIDHPQLQDGMRTHWADATMVDHMETAWAQASYDLVMTFDAYGVSGHINHRAVHRGVRRWARTKADVQVWCLVSTNAIRKFAGVLDAVPSVLSASFSGGRTVCLITPAAGVGRAAMRLHRSQWVWYRRLFVWLARYSYVNTLQLLRL